MFLRMPRQRDELGVPGAVSGSDLLVLVVSSWMKAEMRAAVAPKEMILDIGPGLCAYRLGLLGKRCPEQKANMAYDHMLNLQGKSLALIRHCKYAGTT